jgi:hypothetical protein
MTRIRHLNMIVMVQTLNPAFLGDIHKEIYPSVEFDPAIVNQVRPYIPCKSAQARIARRSAVSEKCVSLV